MGLPLQRTSEAVPSFRSGRTLAGPLRGSCHSGAHPHPPRMCSAPSPERGKAFGRLIAAPTVYPEAILPLSQGPGPEWPAKHGEISEIRREGQFPIPSGPLGHLPLIRGVVPSPTNRKKTLRVWVGEPLGTPAGGKQRGHPHPPPSGAPSPLEGEGLGPVRIRTGSVSSAKSGAVLESQRF